MNLKALKERNDLLSLLVATVAVLLSQFPPAYEWFHSAEIEIKSEHSFALFPNVRSGIAISKYYSATNVGEEPGRIRSIYLFFTDKKGELLHEVRAQGFRLPGADQFGQASWEQFTELALEPGKNWSHLVSFNKRIKNHELGDLRRIQDDIQDERNEWEREMEDNGWDLGSFDEDMPLFEISDELLVDLKKVIEEKIRWFKEGDYILHEVSLTEDSQVIKSYEFTISKFHLSVFADSMDEYAYGLDTAFLPNVVFETVSIETTISTKIKDKIKEYRKF